jgi:hypothetical protein
MENATQQLATIPADLESAVVATNLGQDSALSLRTAFTPYFVKFHELKAKAAEIAVNAPKAAKAMRLQLKAVRVEAEKTRKALNDNSLRYTKAVNGINGILEHQLVPIEEAMQRIEDAEEIAEAARVEALRVERAALLQPYSDPAFYDLGKMPADQWASLFAGQKAAKEAADAAAAKAEADRIAREQAEAAERERIRQENERLKQEAIAREAAAKAEREAAEKKLAEERAEAVRVAAAAKAKADAEAKAAADKAAKEAAAAAEVARQERLRLEAIAEAERQNAAAERAELERKAKAEREAAELAARIEREKREKVEAELRQNAAAEAARIAAEKAAAKKAAAAPDKEKLLAFAKSVRALTHPALSTEEGKQLSPVIASQCEKLAQWIEAKAATL